MVKCHMEWREPINNQTLLAERTSNTSTHLSALTTGSINNNKTFNLINKWLGTETHLLIPYFFPTSLCAPLCVSFFRNLYRFQHFIGRIPWRRECQMEIKTWHIFLQIKFLSKSFALPDNRTIWPETLQSTLVFLPSKCAVYISLNGLLLI